MVRDYNFAFNAVPGESRPQVMSQLVWNPIKATAKGYKTSDMFGFKTSRLRQQLDSCFLYSDKNTDLR